MPFLVPLSLGFPKAPIKILPRVRFLSLFFLTVEDLIASPSVFSFRFLNTTVRAFFALFWTLLCVHVSSQIVSSSRSLAKLKEGVDQVSANTALIDKSRRTGGLWSPQD